MKTDVIILLGLFCEAEKLRDEPRIERSFGVRVRVRVQTCRRPGQAEKRWYALLFAPLIVDLQQPRSFRFVKSKGKRNETATIEGLEARVGIEPTYKGFADLSLTTWVPRPQYKISRPSEDYPIARVGWQGRLRQELMGK